MFYKAKKFRDSNRVMFNPLHPGEFIKETYIEPLNISLRVAAAKLDVSPSTFSRLIKGEADVSPIMALKLCKAFGRSPESWMLMQAEYELWKARAKVNLDRVSIIYSSLHTIASKKSHRSGSAARGDAGSGAR